MLDAIIFSAAMGAVSVWGVLDQNREERKAMKKRHDKRFEEIKQNNRQRRLYSENKINR